MQSEMRADGRHLLSNSSGGSESSASFSKAKVSQYTMVVLGCVGLAFAYVLFFVACVQQPLFPFQPDNLDWTRMWLFTTCGDFWTLALCFSTIVLYTEPDMRIGVAWVAAVNLLGSPFAALWCVLRLRKEQTLALVTSHPRSNMSCTE